MIRRALALALAAGAVACATPRHDEIARAPTERYEGVPIVIPTVVCGPELAEPTLDVEPPKPCAAAKAEPHHFQFLEDTCGIKRWPRDEDREYACASVATTTSMTLTDGRVVEYQPPGETPKYDPALAGIVPDDVDLAVILIRRVGGVPHYRYVSNGTHEATFQTWSASKFLAIANAGAHLREESGGAIGLDGTVDGVPVGDLISIVHTYDEHYYTSNALSKWFHDVGGRKRINEALHGWLGRPEGESLGGDYGAGLVNLSYRFRSRGREIAIARDWSGRFENRVSAHTLAEGLKRLALHREDEVGRMPHLEWVDVRTLFYGAEKSRWFPEQPGGMSADKSVYIQLGADLETLAARAKERWRIFSQSGQGNAQYVHTGYACFPSLDDAGDPIADEGREFVIAARLSGPSGYVGNDRRMARAYRAIVSRIIEGRI